MPRAHRVVFEGRAESQTQWLGLQVGDRISAYNQFAMTSRWARLMAVDAPGTEPRTLTVERAGHTLTVEMQTGNLGVDVLAVAALTGSAGKPRVGIRNVQGHGPLRDHIRPGGNGK
jgi:hypothetical protein